MLDIGTGIAVAVAATASIFNTQIHIFWTLALKRIAFVLAEIRTPFNTNTINVYRIHIHTHTYTHIIHVYVYKAYKIHTFFVYTKDKIIHSMHSSSVFFLSF